MRVHLRHVSIGKKTDTLLLGHWLNQNLPQLSHQCPWNKEGVKILGLFFGTEQCMDKNWEGLLEKVTGKLQRWKWIQAQLSFRGRVLVVNNLCCQSNNPQCCGIV